MLCYIRYCNVTLFQYCSQEFNLLNFPNNEIEVVKLIETRLQSKEGLLYSQLDNSRNS